MYLDVILTDGGYKNTYAILRSLKAKDLKVGIIYNTPLSLSYFSNLVDKRFLVRSNILKNSKKEEMQSFFEEVVNILRTNPTSVFMPVSNVACRFASEFKEHLLQYTKVPVSDLSFMNIAQDKTQTFQFASEKDIIIPKTYYINSDTNLAQFSESVNFPCVIKKTNFFEGGVVYCNSKTELKQSLEKILSKSNSNYSFPIVQEYIEGVGCGYYGIYQSGECVGYFMHERIHEYPVTGGASSLAKSIYDETLRILGDKLLRDLRWTGVAMVEFKRNMKNGKYVLMEINPKFWGSYELSYKAGINFAYLNYLAALEKEIEISQVNYEKDIYFQWIIPDDFLWRTSASKEQRKKFGELKKKVKLYNNIHWDDPFPVIFNTALTIYKLIRDKKYPHGRIN